MSELLPVTQGDREAAASYYLACVGEPHSANDEHRAFQFSIGDMDDDETTQAFARHRTEALASRDRTIGELVGALEGFVGVLWNDVDQRFTMGHLSFRADLRAQVIAARALLATLANETAGGA